MIARWERSSRIDWIAAVAAALAWRAVRWVGWVGPLALTDPTDRQAVYAQAGAVGAASLALFVLPVSLVLSLSTRERLQRIMASKNGQIRLAAVQGAISATLLMIFSVVAIALDATPVGNRAVRVSVPGVFTLAILGIARVLYAFNAVLKAGEAEARSSMADKIRPLRSDKTA